MIIQKDVSTYTKKDDLETMFPDLLTFRKHG